VADSIEGNLSEALLKALGGAPHLFRRSFTMKKNSLVGLSPKLNQCAHAAACVDTSCQPVWICLNALFRIVMMACVQIGRNPQKQCQGLQDLEKSPESKATSLFEFDTCIPAFGAWGLHKRVQGTFRIPEEPKNFTGTCCKHSTSEHTHMQSHSTKQCASGWSTCPWSLP